MKSNHTLPTVKGALDLLLVFDRHPYYTAIDKSFKSAFEAKGTKVEEFAFEPVSAGRVSRKALHLSDGLRRWATARQGRRLVEVVKQRRPEVIFIIKGHAVFPGLLREIRAVHPQGLLVCFNPDDPFNLRGCRPNIRKSIPCYDHYFIWSKALIPALYRAGARSVHYLPFAADTRLLYPVCRGPYRYDLSFHGNGDPERQEYVNAVAHILREGAYPFRLHVFGQHWEHRGGPVAGKAREGLQYLAGIGRSAVNLNILRAQNKGATNMRTFEIPAAGGFLLHEHSEGAMEFFIPGREAVYFSTPEELVDKAAFYLKNPACREKIRRAGYKKAVSYKCSYEERIDRILFKMGNWKSRACRQTGQSERW